MQLFVCCAYQNINASQLSRVRMPYSDRCLDQITQIEKHLMPSMKSFFSQTGFKNIDELFHYNINNRLLVKCPFYSR